MEKFREICSWVVAESLWPRRRRVVVQELLAHQKMGRRVIIVSGMFEPLLEALLKFLPAMEATQLLNVSFSFPTSSDYIRLAVREDWVDPSYANLDYGIGIGAFLGSGVTVVPEPSTLLLLGAGLLAVAGRKPRAAP